MLIKTLLSGGQEGVDMACVDVALELGIPLDGYLPKGRYNEKGPLPENFPLREFPDGGYAARTRANVEMAGCVLLFTNSVPPTGGTLLTQKCCKAFAKPMFVVNFSDETYLDLVDVVHAWLEDFGEPPALLVAGPRESKHPSGYHKTKFFLLALLGRDDFDGQR